MPTGWEMECGGLQSDEAVEGQVVIHNLEDGVQLDGWELVWVSSPNGCGEQSGQGETSDIYGEWEGLNEGAT